ncbi:MAG: hypothetical protein AAF456_08940 [Planctomycetota bacterium]
MNPASVHVIRLHGPWEVRVDESPAGRIRVPDGTPDLSECSGSELKLSRKFNSPTSLLPDQNVDLVIEFDPEKQAEVDLLFNSEVKLSATTDAEIRMSIRRDLKPHNLIEVRCHLESAVQRRICIVSARLEIAPPSDR